MKHPALLAALAWLVAWPALAAMPSQPSRPMPPRPPRLGRCAACHGVHGIAVVPGVPNLAGQRLDYLLKAIKEYRTGQRDVQVMQVAVGPLSWQQLKQLARWFAAQPPGGVNSASDASGGHS